jgi:hypothetical protein
MENVATDWMDIQIISLLYLCGNLNESVPSIADRLTDSMELGLLYEANTYSVRQEPRSQQLASTLIQINLLAPEFYI